MGMETGNHALFKRDYQAMELIQRRTLVRQKRHFKSHNIRIVLWSKQKNLLGQFSKNFHRELLKLEEFVFANGISFSKN